MTTEASGFERQSGQRPPADDVLEGDSAKTRAPRGIPVRHPSRYASRRNGMDPARALGWLSVGLGLGGLLAPRALGQLIGMPGHESLLRAVGARELASAAGLLTQRKATP